MSLGYCHGYTYSSPNTMWINVVHKYNRGVRDTIKDTLQVAYFL